MRPASSPDRATSCNLTAVGKTCPTRKGWRRSTNERGAGAPDANSVRLQIHRRQRIDRLEVDAGRMQHLGRPVLEQSVTLAAPDRSGRGEPVGVDDTDGRGVVVFVTDIDIAIRFGFGGVAEEAAV